MNKLTIKVSENNSFIKQDLYSYQDLKALTELIYKSVWDQNNIRRLLTKEYIFSTDIYFLRSKKVNLGDLKLYDGICPFDYLQFLKQFLKNKEYKMENINLKVNHVGQFLKKEKYTHEELVLQLELMYRAMVYLQTGEHPTPKQCYNKVALSFIEEGDKITVPIQLKYPKWFGERKKFLDSQIKGGIGK
jgi:hypothetical protein